MSNDDVAKPTLRDMVLTVGALSRILAEHHESDIVYLDGAITDGVIVKKYHTSVGVRVVFEEPEGPVTRYE